LKDFVKPKTELINKESDVKGIPSFWLKVFQNCNVLSGLIANDDDKKVLESLISVTSVPFEETEIEKNGKRMCQVYF
jgi:hypothetical protein